MTKHLSANLRDSLTRCLAPDRQAYVLSLPDEHVNPSHGCFQEEGAVEPVLRGQPRADCVNSVEAGSPALQGQTLSLASSRHSRSTGLKDGERSNTVPTCSSSSGARQAQALPSMSALTAALRPATCRCPRSSSSDPGREIMGPLLTLVARNLHTAKLPSIGHPVLLNQGQERRSEVRKAGPVGNPQGRGQSPLPRTEPAGEHPWSSPWVSVLHKQP